MTRYGYLTVLGIATALATGTLPRPLAAAAGDDPPDLKHVVVVGCAVKGDGDGDGFLLANAIEQTTRTTTVPTATGAVVSSSTTSALGPARVLYWLDDDDDVVEPLMGRQVEVVGNIEGDIDKGRIEIERENGMIELEIKADGKKATVKLPEVPSAVGGPRSVRDREHELRYTVRKLDVKSAKMLAATCGAS